MSNQKETCLPNHSGVLLPYLQKRVYIFHVVVNQLQSLEPRSPGGEGGIFGGPIRWRSEPAFVDKFFLDLLASIQPLGGQSEATQSLDFDIRQTRVSSVPPHTFSRLLRQDYIEKTSKACQEGVRGMMALGEKRGFADT